MAFLEFFTFRSSDAFPKSLLVQNLTNPKSLIIKGNHSHRLSETKTKNKITMFATKLLIAALAFAGSQATRIEESAVADLQDYSDY